MGPLGATVNLGIDVQRRDPWVVLTPLGDLDMGSAPAVRQAIVGAIAAGDTRLVIDLGSVDFIDSVGLGVIIGARRRARSNGGDVVLARLTESTRQVFALVELDQIFDVTLDVDRAVGQPT
ncbi:MAG: STAS domain-containing protein [Acidimicrobiia bacterium]|nr:STAS domain-containing protein [Acidimicrobiia bacterium]